MSLLSGKEKRKLRALGNRLKPELWIGKGGISRGIIQSLENSLRTKELVKVKILETSPLDRQASARQLARETHAEVVQILGNTILLFRPLPEEDRN